MYIPRLRKINDVIKQVKENDPKIEINWKLIQRLIKTGKLTTRKFGDAWLINLDEFYSFFWTREKRK